MWSITQKDITLFFKDKKALFLGILLPIGLITLFAMAFGGVLSDDETEGRPISVLFTDEDNTNLSSLLIASIDSIPGINFISSTIGDAQNQIRRGDQIANIIIYTGFEDSLQKGGNIPVELQYDKSREMEIGILHNLLLNKLGEISGKINSEKGIDEMVKTLYAELPLEMQDSLKQNILAKQALGNNNRQLITTTSLVGDEESNWGLIQAVAGTAIMMLLFNVSAIGQSLLDEKTSGVLKKLLQSPIKPINIMFGKVLTAIILSSLQLTIMFIFSWLAFGLNIFINLPALIIMILITAIACSSVGILLASIVSTKKQAESLGTIVILFMSAIGGSMIPLYIMPSIMQNFAVMSLNYWSIQGFYDIFWRRTGIDGIAENVYILSAISILLIATAAYFFKRNLLKLT